MSSELIEIKEGLNIETSNAANVIEKGKIISVDEIGTIDPLEHITISAYCTVKFCDGKIENDMYIMQMNVRDCN
jgi:hypothetical protein